MVIRRETQSDVEAISAVTQAAFADHPFSKATEHFIVSALRVAGALTLSLVAEIDGQEVGHVAFSPITISDRSCDWFGLGPISVAPAHQRKGIGTALIREGLSRLKALGAQGCVLVGDPEYYKRFAFRSYPELIHDGVPPENLLALPFDRHRPQGLVEFHPGFGATG